MPTILIATDDASLGANLSAEIEGMGYDARWETDGYAALEAAMEQTPHAVLADANLSIHTGIELAGLLRAEPALPKEMQVILLSDDAFEPHALERAGVSKVFSKSGDGAALRELIVDAVGAVPWL